MNLLLWDQNFNIVGFYSQIFRLHTHIYYIHMRTSWIGRYTCIHLLSFFNRIKQIVEMTLEFLKFIPIAQTFIFKWIVCFTFTKYHRWNVLFAAEFHSDLFSNCHATILQLFVAHISIFISFAFQLTAATLLLALREFSSKILKLYK